MPVEIEVHTVPHFKGTINAKMEPEGLECNGISIFYQVGQKLGCFLNKTKYFNSLLHTLVRSLILVTDLFNSE